jgi:hypothetical protein
LEAEWSVRRNVLRVVCCLGRHKRYREVVRERDQEAAGAFDEEVLATCSDTVDMFHNPVRLNCAVTHSRGDQGGNRFRKIIRIDVIHGEFALLDGA